MSTSKIVGVIFFLQCRDRASKAFFKNAFYREDNVAFTTRRPQELN